jgi:hypothetical protein
VVPPDPGTAERFVEPDPQMVREVKEVTPDGRLFAVTVTNTLLTLSQLVVEL